MFDMIAFDADDTLWHNMTTYKLMQDKCARLLVDYIDADELDKKLFATESRNIAFFGYGIKSFTLSLIETAIEITNGNIRGDIIKLILQYAKEMITAPVQLINHVPEVLEQVSKNFNLMIITKGDLLDQCGKVERSGLTDYFTNIEVVHEKQPETYARIMKVHHIAPSHFLMVGNSLRSDVLPVLAAGGTAVHIPYEITWAYEHVVLNPEDDIQHVELEHIGLLPAWLQQYL
jgi:putative hydrolase of the HAD superfamily